MLELESRVTRRGFARGVGAMLLAGGWCGARGAEADEKLPWVLKLEERLGELEAKSEGRLGVAVMDLESGARAGHRAGERFPMCSTFKLLAAAAVLARVDAGQEQLTRRVRYAAADLVEYSPTTKDHVGGEGMPVAGLCEAALTLSDNTAGNLLLASVGGPAGLTAYVRTLGDKVTRLDRNEPTVNEAAPGDPRDTTTPEAMAGNLRKLLLGEALSASSRTLLTGWLVGNKTGAARLRAGLPHDWRVGDKTGMGGRGTNNDVAVIWPPKRKPLVVAAYLTDTKVGTERGNALLAEVARAVAAALGG